MPVEKKAFAESTGKNPENRKIAPATCVTGVIFISELWCYSGMDYLQIDTEVIRAGVLTILMVIYEGIREQP